MNNIFVPTVVRIMLNFLPEVVIWWMLEMHSGVLCSFGRDLTYGHHCWLRHHIVVLFGGKDLRRSRFLSREWKCKGVTDDMSGW